MNPLRIQTLQSTKLLYFYSVCHHTHVFGKSSTLFTSEVTGWLIEDSWNFPNDFHKLLIAFTANAFLPFTMSKLLTRAKTSKIICGPPQVRFLLQGNFQTTQGTTSVCMNNCRQIWEKKKRTRSVHHSGTPRDERTLVWKIHLNSKIQRKLRHQVRTYLHPSWRVSYVTMVWKTVTQGRSSSSKTEACSDLMKHQCYVWRRKNSVLTVKHGGGGIVLCGRFVRFTKQTASWQRGIVKECLQTSGREVKLCSNETDLQNLTGLHRFYQEEGAKTPATYCEKPVEGYRMDKWCVCTKHWNADIVNKSLFF